MRGEHLVTHDAGASRGDHDRGAALVFALLGLMSLTVLGLGLMTLTLSATTATGNERDTVRALLIADTGIAHARKLILWKEWQSFDQFLKNDTGSNSGVGCTGDELVDAPAAPLPPGYPAFASDFIPAAGVAYAGGTYQVFVCDDDPTDWDTSVTPAVLNADPSVDKNRRIIIRSVGTAPNGATATIELVLGAQDLPALIVNGNLSLPGTSRVTGVGGAAFSNGTMRVEGNPCAEQFFGSVGSIDILGNSTGTGTTCSNTNLDLRPDSAPMTIPVFNPTDYKSMATYWLENDGRIYLAATGAQITLPGWSFASNTWSSNSSVPGGTYWVNGNVVVGGSPGSPAAPLPLTILATLSVDIAGSPRTVPALAIPGIAPQPVGVSVIAGTDLKMAGNTSQLFTGIYYANHQVDIAGSPTINGQVLAGNVADTNYAPGTTNKVSLSGGYMVITGSPTINFAGSGLVGTSPLAWRECRTTTDPTNPCGPLWGGLK
jgi:hypothetical protein